jgi:hypothetical protein
LVLVLCAASLFFCTATAQQQASPFSWPEGKQAAVSLSFDDARESQVLAGTSLLDQYGIKATFFVVPAAVERQLEGWKNAVRNGHEIGNHTVTHPCTGNFAWSRNNALEDYSLKRMRQEMMACNKQITALLGVTPQVFAYPCGQKFVGSGTHTKSYVPLVAKNFLLGRGWMDEAPNDPAYNNFAQLTGVEMDGKNFRSDFTPVGICEEEQALAGTRRPRNGTVRRTNNAPRHVEATGRIRTGSCQRTLDCADGYGCKIYKSPNRFNAQLK